MGGRLSFRWEADNLAENEPATAFGPGSRIKKQDFGSLDAQLSYIINENYRIRLDVTNLLDKKYFGMWGVPNAYGDFTYSPQPPLSVYLGLEMNWDKRD